jgi:CubicO group peptidase (beta-lactamase class C family)
MTQTSGLSFAWGNAVAAVPGDSVAYVLGLPFVHQPGTFFEYAQDPLQVVGAMVSRAVGMDLQDFAQQELFGPIGIPRGRWTWQRDGAGHTLGFAGLAMASIDLARLGSLLLNDGRWRDRGVIAADYVHEMSRPTPANPGYGLLTWTNEGDSYVTVSALVRKVIPHRWLPAGPPDLFAISGLGDQEMWVIPSLDMVVVRTGNPMLTSGWRHLFLARLLAGVRDVQLPDPGPPPIDDGVDLSDFSKLIDLSTWPTS